MYNAADKVFLKVKIWQISEVFSRNPCEVLKKAVPLHSLLSFTETLTEADRRYLKDLQYRQTVQEAGIFIPAARAAMREDAWV